MKDYVEKSDTVSSCSSKILSITSAVVLVLAVIIAAIFLKVTFLFQ